MCTFSSSWSRYINIEISWYRYRGTWDVLAIGFGLVTAISMVWVAGTSFFGLTSEHRDNDDEDDDDDVDDQKALFLEG